jgi:signal transduction histidine kinase
MGPLVPVTGSCFAPRARFLFLAILCVAVTTVSSVYVVRWLLKPNTGLVVDYPEVIVTDHQALFSPRAPFSAAVASGLRAGQDRIVSVAGRAVRSSRDLLVADAAITSFRPFPVVVDRPGVGEVSVLITPWFTPSRIEWVFVLAFCLALCCVAFTLSWRLSSQPGTIPLVLAALSYLLFTCVKPFYYESLLSNALIHFGKITSWLLVFFALSFPWERGSRPFRLTLRCVVLAFYAGFIVARLALYARWTASGEERWLDRYRLLGQVGNGADLVAYLSLVALLLSAYVWARSPSDRKRLQWILAGIAIALPPYFFFDQLPLLLSRSEARVSLGAFAQLFLSFVPIFLLIGLTRHQRLRLRAFLARYLSYVGLFACMVALFAVAYLPLRGYLAEGYRIEPPASDLIACAAILVCLGCVRLLFERLTRRWLRVGAPGIGWGALEPGSFGGGGEAPKPEPRANGAEARREARQILRPLLRGLAHRLREPLQVLTSVAPTSDLRAQEAALHVTEALETLESLAGSEPLPTTAARPRTLAVEAQRLVGERYPAVRFLLQGEGVRPVSCHPEPIARALAALLENAAEAQGGEGVVTIRLVEEEARTRIDVCDTGLGLGVLARRRLFAPFYTTKPGHQGLGLFRARAAVEQSEGELEVGEGDDGGTCARVSLLRAHP